MAIRLCNIITLSRSTGPPSSSEMIEYVVLEIQYNDALTSILCLLADTVKHSYNQLKLRAKPVSFTLAFKLITVETLFL